MTKRQYVGVYRETDVSKPREMTLAPHTKLRDQLFNGKVALARAQQPSLFDQLNAVVRILCAKFMFRWHTQNVV